MRALRNPLPKPPALSPKPSPHLISVENLFPRPDSLPEPCISIAFYFPAHQSHLRFVGIAFTFFIHIRIPTVKSSLYRSPPSFQLSVMATRAHRRTLGHEPEGYDQYEEPGLGSWIRRNSW